jgi:trans-aconitate 2-methyltransferase
VPARRAAARGRLVAQCGGAGNIAAVHAAAAATGALDAGWEGPWNFATPAETEDRLRRAGFRDVRAWLQDWPVQPPEPRTFLRTICLGPHLEQLPVARHDAFLDEVMRRLGDPLTLDYVRLNLQAVA